MDVGPTFVCYSIVQTNADWSTHLLQHFVLSHTLTLLLLLTWSDVKFTSLVQMLTSLAPR